MRALRVGCVALAILVPATRAPLEAQTITTGPGEFIVEPPTLMSLGFEWRISGDDNRNAQSTSPTGKRASGLAQRAFRSSVSSMSGERRAVPRPDPSIPTVSLQPRLSTTGQHVPGAF